MDVRKLTARDVMTPDPVTVPSHLSLPELGAFLVERRISGAPVVDAHGLLVGVVSVADLARAAGLAGGLAVPRESDYLRFGELRLVQDWEETPSSAPEPFHGDLGDHTVADIMSTLIYSVSEEAPVSEIARVMIRHHHHRVLVARDDQLLGIVTSLDLVALLLGEPDRATLLESLPGWGAASA